MMHLIYIMNYGRLSLCGSEEKSGKEEEEDAYGGQEGGLR